MGVLVSFFETSGLHCVSDNQLSCCRSSRQRRVSGGDAGLPADADGGFLSESGDCAALPDRDRGPLLWPAPQRPHAALPDENRTRRPQLHRGQRLSERRKTTAATEILIIHRRKNV